MKSSRISSTNWFDNCTPGGAWALFELREAPFLFFSAYFQLTYGLNLRFDYCLPVALRKDSNKRIYRQVYSIGTYQPSIPPLRKPNTIEIVIDTNIHNTYIICMYNYSKHSLDRLDERNFSKEPIESILNKEVDVVIYPSTRDEDIDLYFGKYGGKHILVVYNRRTSTIVTVRNMRKKEKEIFNEVMRHEKE